MPIGGIGKSPISFVKNVEKRVNKEARLYAIKH